MVFLIAELQLCLLPLCLVLLLDYIVVRFPVMKHDDGGRKGMG